MILNEEGVVLGRMFGKDLDADPNVSAIEMLEYMDQNDLETVPVTTPDGKLVGRVARADVERATSRMG